MVPTNTFPSMVSKQGSLARLSITVSPARFRIIGWQARLSRKVPKQCCNKGSTNRFPSKVPKNRLLMFPGTAFQEQLAKKKIEEQRKNSASNVGSKNRIPSKVPKDRFLNKVPKQSYEKNAKNRFPSKVPMNRFEASRQRESSQEQVTRQCSQEQVPKNRLPRTGSQARLSTTGSQARFR